MKCPEEVKLSREDGEALRIRLSGDALTAAERILVRKVGGGYMFIHRLLQEDSFAALHTKRDNSTTQDVAL